MKQSYELEEFRVLRDERLRNLMVLVTAAMFFAAVVLGRQAKLKVLVGHALAAAKRLFGIPDFCYVAQAFLPVADGLHEALRPLQPPPPASSLASDPSGPSLAAAPAL